MPPAGEWYGSPNYTAGRPAKPDRILLHHMAGSIESARARFQNDASDVSAHYGVGLDAELDEYVHPDDVAWHSGSWPYNQRSIGIETETVAGNYDAPRTDALYARTASLVAALSREYGIPIDTTHVEDHRIVVATYCPGTLNVARVLREALATAAPSSVPIMGPSRAGFPTVSAYIRARAPAAPALYPVMLLLVAAEFGVRAEVMLAQAVKETGRFAYGGSDAVFSADASYNNFAGIKTTDGKATARFATVELGLVAQAAHLAWYASPSHVATPRCAKTFDPRHFGSAHNGSADDVRELGGKWAPALDYGATIVPLIDEILGFVDEGDAVSFDPRRVAADKDFLDARIREVVMGEDIAAFGVWRTLGREVAPRQLARTGELAELDVRAGHGAGIDKPPRGPRQAKRPTRGREATR